MSAIDYAAAYSAIWTRAATDAAGSAFRATLGGASSIFPVRDLARYKDPQGSSRPALPWAVWKRGGIGGESGAMRSLAGLWFLYVDPVAGSMYQLDTVTTALESLFGSVNRLALSGGSVRVTFIGAPFEDTALNLIGREVRISFDRRG